MTNSQDYVDKVLDLRAERLAVVSEEQRRDCLYQVGIVVVGEEHFGIPAHFLREIIPAPAIARLPAMPDWIRGISQIRGELICVVDTAALFEIETVRQQEFLVIVDGEEGPLGLLVDEALTFREVLANEVLQDHKGARSDRPVLARTNDLVAILDMGRVLRDKRLVIDHSCSGGALIDDPQQVDEPDSMQTNEAEEGNA